MLKTISVFMLSRIYLKKHNLSNSVGVSVWDNFIELITTHPRKSKTILENLPKKAPLQKVLFLFELVFFQPEFFQAQVALFPKSIGSWHIKPRNLLYNMDWFVACLVQDIWILFRILEYNLGIDMSSFCKKFDHNMFRVNSVRFLR